MDILNCLIFSDEQTVWCEIYKDIHEDEELVAMFTTLPTSRGEVKVEEDSLSPRSKDISMDQTCDSNEVTVRGSTPSSTPCNLDLGPREISPICAVDEEEEKSRSSAESPSKPTFRE